jgi:hypothetical protein
MSDRQIAHHAYQIAREWRAEEIVAVKARNYEHAAKCHQSAIVLEDFARLIEQRELSKRWDAA